MAKLKVFSATLGFFDTVVAAPSKAAALEAWGARQDLFATGAAAKVEDEQIIAAALARPGVVLRRPVGATGGFKEAAGLEGIKLPKAAKPKPARAEAPPAGAPEPAARPRKPPSRKALSAAEAALADRLSRYERERGAIEAKREKLDRQARALRDAFDAERAELDRARARAAEAYRKAGG